jgi:hypothetical protein
MGGGEGVIHQVVGAVARSTRTNADLRTFLLSLVVARFL